MKLPYYPLYVIKPICMVDQQILSEISGLINIYFFAYKYIMRKEVFLFLLA